MKQMLIKLCWPILAFFEQDGDAHGYKPSHRKALLGVAFLFWFLAATSLYFVISAQLFGALLPVIIFFAIGLVCMVVGWLGSDNAVTNIWGKRH